MNAQDLDNDTRGWIMCSVSGIACIAGSFVVCVDLLIRYIPGKENFRVQDSNVFLASSLSLSFGVMLFSALYSMLPSSKKYLLKDGYDDLPAGLIMMGCFVAGFVGIQGLSRILHRMIPSHVVDCEPSNDRDGDDDETKLNGNGQDQDGEHSGIGHGRRPYTERGLSLPGTQTPPAEEEEEDQLTQPLETTPLLGGGKSQRRPASINTARPGTLARKSSVNIVKDQVVSFVRDPKGACDESGPCHGYTDPSSQDCTKQPGSRTALTRHASLDPTLVSKGSDGNARVSVSALPEMEFESDQRPDPRLSPTNGDKTHKDAVTSHHNHVESRGDHSDSPNNTDRDLESQQQQHHHHHHHVPTNAFLSIGLQTVIAITLHKFPEGFIMYATNHANPTLGFNIFMSLFVHNIAEGFAMALPLYMAIGSRWKAIFWSSLLGGFSQPVGAGIAVLVFKVSEGKNVDIDNTAYACLFAITAGIMASVALQLFVESLSLNSNRNLCIAFAFFGMVLLGVSNALVN